MRRLAPVLLLVGCGWLAGEPDARTYTVVRGDTLSKIAAREGVTVAELRTWNGISGDLIEVGQVLRIEGGTAVAEPTRRSAPKRARRAAATTPSTAPTAPSLTMPAPKPCAPPPDLDAERGMAASTGLDPASIRPAVDAMLPHVVACVTDAVPTGTAQLAFTVGCDGRVRAVRMAADPGWDSATSSCILDVYRHAAFPAHSLPDGDTFTIPLGFD